MDRPAIQYVASTDGVSVPYWRIGSGPPLVVLEDWPFSNVEAEWRIDEAREVYEELAEHFSVVRFDVRNTGLATRGVERCDLDAMTDDMEAVIKAIGEPVCIVALQHAGKIAVNYAAHGPDRVNGLLLVEAPVGQIYGGELYRGVEILAPLITENWSLYARLMITAFFGLEDPQRTRLMADYLEAQFDGDPAAFRRLAAILTRTEVLDVLPRLACPVLILHRPRMGGIESAREVAQLLPGTAITVLEDRGFDAFVPPDAIPIIDEFFAVSQPLSSASGRGGFRTLMFTDLTASTAATQRLGDAAAQDLVRAHNDIVRAALTNHEGHEIKHTGDGIMAWFPAASNGLDCAQAIQQGVADLGNPDLGVKIGLNAGEPIAEEDDLYGTAVQIAARVTDQAGAGEIVVTNVVRELVAGKAYLFSEREPASLKGVEEPVRLFALRTET